MLEFSTKYKKKVDLPFQCLIRPNLITEELVKALKFAGCECVSMGIESGSQRVRMDVLNRHITNAQIINGIKILKKYKLKFITFNIFGIPGETIEEMIETVKINLEIKPYSIYAYIFYPFPGVDLMKSALKQGYLNKEAVKLLENGEGSYQTRSILDHPNKNEAYNIKVILPLLNNLPKKVHSYFLDVWIYKKHSNFLLNMLTIISLIFRSPFETRERIKELLAAMFPATIFFLRRL